jgi:hypothetical protein
MPGAMPPTIIPEAPANTGLRQPRALTAIPDTSIEATESMAQTMEEQTEALFPEAQAVSQASSINPFRVVSSALRSGLLSVQRDNSREMNRILQSIEHCEQHVRNQADYIQRIDSALKREGDASVIHARQLNSMVVSISDHGRGIKALSDTVSDLLTQTSAINTSVKGQAKQLTDLQALVTSFRDQVFSIQEREEPQAEEGEPSPVVEVRTSAGYPAGRIPTFCGRKFPRFLRCGHRCGRQNRKKCAGFSAGFLENPAFKRHRSRAFWRIYPGPGCPLCPRIHATAVM